MQLIYAPALLRYRTIEVPAVENIFLLLSHPKPVGCYLFETSSQEVGSKEILAVKEILL